MIFSLSKQDFLQEIPNSVMLEDGTPSYKDYSTCRYVLLQTITVHHKIGGFVSEIIDI